MDIVITVSVMDFVGISDTLLVSKAVIEDHEYLIRVAFSPESSLVFCQCGVWTKEK